MKRAFLILLVIVCLAVVVWTAYLLFTHQTEPVLGGIILAVDIGVLFWNISVLRAYRITAGTLVAVFLVVALIGMTAGAFAGIEPFAGLKDRMLGLFAGLPTKYDNKVLPGQSASIDNWFITLDDGGWKGSTLYVELTITNLGSRRNFGAFGPRLIAIDSTGKEIDPWLPEYSWKDIAEAIKEGRTLQTKPPYHKEYYPNEKWSGEVKFEMSPYSGKTGLYIRLFGYPQKHYLFDLGEPGTTESTPVTPSTSLHSAIIGRWRHGLPEQCPPSMDFRLYEELKRLPENETYYLEFTDSGKVSFLRDENTIVNGTYRFVSDRYIQLNWAVSLVPTAQQFFSQHGVYEIQFSEETMYLTNEYQIGGSYRRAS